MHNFFPSSTFDFVYVARWNVDDVFFSLLPTVSLTFLLRFLFFSVSSGYAKFGKRGPFRVSTFVNRRREDNLNESIRFSVRFRSADVIRNGVVSPNIVRKPRSSEYLTLTCFISSMRYKSLVKMFETFILKWYFILSTSFAVFLTKWRSL